MPQAKRRRLLKGSMSTALLALLSACGGGGGGGSGGGATPPVVTPPVVTPPVVPPYVDPGPVGLTLQAGAVDAVAIIDGSGLAAHFSNIVDISPDGNGNYYVADRDNGSTPRRTVRKVSAAGTVTTLHSSSFDPRPSDDPLLFAVAAASDGGAYVFEPHGGTRLLRIAATGGASVVLSGTATLGKLRDLAPAPNGGVYLVNPQSISLLDATGRVTLLAGNDDNPDQLRTDGQGSAARFASISSALVTRQGELLLIDGAAGHLRLVSAAGTVSTLPPLQAPVGPLYLRSIAAGPDASIYFLATGEANYTVYQRGADGRISEVISGGSVRGGFGYYPGSPQGLVSGSDGSLLLYSTAELRRISGNQLLPFAGLQNSWGMDLDGNGAAARFAAPYLVAGDRAGNAYIVDHPGEYINPIVGEAGGLFLRKVAPDGRVSTLAVAPEMKILTGLVLDLAGNLYLSERSVSSYHTPTYGGAIHKITPDGKVTLLAGEAGAPGAFRFEPLDGIGSGARFARPVVLGVDDAGNVYARDAGTAPYRKIAPDGSTTSLAVLPASIGLAPDGQRYELGESGVLRVGADGVKTEVANWRSLPPDARTPRGIAATGLNSFALIVGEAIFKLVLPR